MPPPMKLELDPEPDDGVSIKLDLDPAAEDDAAMDFEITEEPVLVEGELVLAPPEPEPEPEPDLVLADVSAGAALDLPMDPSLENIQGFELDTE
jgi:hypothetical protein